MSGDTVEKVVNAACAFDFLGLLYENCSISHAPELRPGWVWFVKLIGLILAKDVGSSDSGERALIVVCLNVRSFEYLALPGGLWSSGVNCCWRDPLFKMLLTLSIHLEDLENRRDQTPALLWNVFIEQDGVAKEYIRSIEKQNIISDAHRTTIGQPSLK